MSPIPQKLRKQMDQDPSYKTCMAYGYLDHKCEGRLTREHTLEFAGKQVQELWAIISLCAHGHGVDQFQDNANTSKELRVWVALNRATDSELMAISKAVDYLRERARLNAIYGVWSQKIPDPNEPKNIWGKSATQSPIPHGMNYFVSEEEQAMVDRCVKVNREMLGVYQNPHMMIRTMIENYHFSLGEAIKKELPDDYKKLGFEK